MGHEMETGFYGLESYEVHFPNMLHLKLERPTDLPHRLSERNPGSEAPPNCCSLEESQELR